MKIIVYCVGAEITYYTSISKPGPRDTVRDEEDTNIPSITTLKEIFPKEKTRIYFDSPSSEYSQDNYRTISRSFSPYNRGMDTYCWSYPIYRILVEHDSLEYDGNGLCFIEPINVIDVISACFPMHGWTCYYDSYVPDKEKYYSLMFDKSKKANVTLYPEILQRFNSFWFKEQEDRLIQLSAKLDAPVEGAEDIHFACNHFFDFIYNEINSLLNDGQTKGKYYAMLLIVIELFQHNDVVNYLNDDSRNKIDLLQSKIRASKFVRDYYCPWKFSIFGHHNNARALVVSEEILKRNNIADVQEILQDQKHIFEGSRNGNFSSFRFFPEWIRQDCLIQTKKGGFYIAVLDALRSINERPMAQFQR